MPLNIGLTRASILLPFPLLFRTLIYYYYSIYISSNNNNNNNTFLRFYLLFSAIISSIVSFNSITPPTIVALARLANIEYNATIIGGISFYSSLSFIINTSALRSNSRANRPIPNLR